MFLISLRPCLRAVLNFFLISSSTLSRSPSSLFLNNNLRTIGGLVVGTGPQGEIKSKKKKMGGLISNSRGCGDWDYGEYNVLTVFPSFPGGAISSSKTGQVPK